MDSKLSKLGYLIVSLILAILLAGYANSQQDSSVTRNAQSKGTNGGTGHEKTLGLIATKKSTFSVPLRLNGIDTEDYYISGAPQNVKITVSGSSALVTSAQNTKNFQVYADLKNLTEGEHTINLKVSGMSNDLTYKLQPEKVTMSIAKRAVTNYSVQTKFDNQAIANGYHAGKPTSSVNAVEVMGSSESVQSVQSVVANVNVPRDTKADIRQDITLQALDANGKPVNVSISPQVTTIKIPIIGGEGSRQVPLKFNGKNGNLKEFNVDADVNEVTISGETDDIEKVKDVQLDIDLKDIEQTKTFNLNLPEKKHVKMEPDNVTVVVTPKEQN